MNEKTVWDVVVIGGGPAGMMAAGRAGARGLKVILLEKNSTLGKKLLITGGGRCNVTNSEFDNRKLLEKFKDNDKFLFSAFAKWSVKETLDFFHERGMQTKVENELRTFPTSNKAQSVFDVLVQYMEEGGVTVSSDSPVSNFIKEKENLIGVKLKNKKIILGRSFILATGGISRPETGSTGDGYKWLSDLGHAVIEPTPSLVPISTKDKWVKKLSGKSISDIKITLLQNNEKQGVTKGKVLFTHLGLSGPTILNMSKDIGELLKYGEVFLSLDLLPKEDYSTLNDKLQELFKKHDKKDFKNALSDLVPSAIVPVLVELSKIKPETKCHSIKREERLTLVNLLKSIPIQVDKLLGIDKAVISSGGVVLDEVDFKTMRSRLYQNLYLIGDILNIDRPSGGYSLQLCWTTGFVAGDSVE
ncbi:MAG: Flavoprotein family protein [Parcubacteria bacterium C7867-005]|nr:MAG: Flavoprotein family protein [Parcubacteria bacterium C7867-005]